MKKPPLVELTWVDAIDRNESCLLSEVPTSRYARLFTRVTSGYLVLQDEERTVLAYDFDPPEPDDEEATVGKFLAIPSSLVKQVRHVRKSRSKAEKVSLP